MSGDNQHIDSELMFDVPERSGAVTEDVVDVAAKPAAAGVGQKHLEKQIARWKDPFTLPHSKAECSKWAYPWPGAKICIGWTVKWQFLYGNLWVIIDVSDPVDLDTALSDSLRDATIAAVAAGVATAFVTSGPGAGEAAMSAFTATLKISLAGRITAKVLDVRAENRTAWGGWE